MMAGIIFNRLFQSCLLYTSPLEVEDSVPIMTEYLPLSGNKTDVYKRQGHAEGSDSVQESQELWFGDGSP